MIARMGDHDQPDRTQASRRMTVREAAGKLGITVEAVRNRIKRGTLPSEKEGGSVFVLLDQERGTDQTTGQPEAGRDQPQPDDRPAELVEELRNRIAYLERQVEEEREARRRADTLMARLMDRVPELPPAPPQDAPGARESATEDRPGTNTPTASASPQTGTQRRPWWRRLLRP